MLTRLLVSLSLLLVLPSSLPLHAAEGDWISLFDGQTLRGWKASEATNSWSIVDGAIVANGKPRSHLFYVGPHAPFTNFIFEATILTTPGSNGGIYFHTRYQDSNWPKYGFELQVNQTHKDRIKTGSLYQVANVMDNSPARDNQWFTMRLTVRGKYALVEVDGKKINEYTEPEGKQPGSDFTRVFDSGTFAFQAHDPNSSVHFKNIRMQRLP